MSKPFCHWPLAWGFCTEPNLISPYMPIFNPGTGAVPTPNRSLPFWGGGGGALRSAASRNFGWAPEDFGSANGLASAGSLDAGDESCATAELFDPPVFANFSSVSRLLICCSMDWSLAISACSAACSLFDFSGASLAASAPALNATVDTAASSDDRIAPR